MQALARRGLELLLCVALCFLAAMIGRGLSMGEPGEWYAALRKPWFNPPNWVFAPVWTALYAAMGVSLWLVWQKRREYSVRGALVWFGVQLALNASWPGLFFGLRNPGIAFTGILLLWLAIGVTLLRFSKLSKMAAWLLAPYWAWVSFASLLNLALWQMNQASR